ncbi:MAG TPA: LysM peptidoglycan-binding domain-containing protein, partial [Anaerolineales bacterium]
PSRILQPYDTATPRAIASPGAVAIKPPDIPLPSPTPFLYTIKSGDSLGSIAQKFNVGLDALVALNPDVNPNAMRVGETLKIPSKQKTIAGEPTPTPAPFAIQQIGCRPTADHGLWCYALARNDAATPLENMTVQLSLLDAKGQIAGSQTALLPLDILPPGEALPLTASFPPTVSSDVVPRVQVLTALQLLPNDPRYLAATVQDSEVRVDWSGLTAQVSGHVALPADSKPASSVWVAGVAYDRSGAVIGLRKWESSSGMQAGSLLPFSFLLSSLAGEIERVDFAVEARP